MQNIRNNLIKLAIGKFLNGILSVVDEDDF